jgi:acetylornithine deacetylase
MPADINPYNLNLGRIDAGDWLSTVPSKASFGIRIGYPRSWSATRAEMEIRSLISSFAAAAKFAIEPRVTLNGFRAEGYLLDADTPLARDLSAAHAAAHGSLPEIETLGSTTDARTYLRHFGIPAVCYGAIAHEMYGIDENVELRSIVDAARTLARFILMRFGGEVPA